MPTMENDSCVTSPRSYASRPAVLGPLGGTTAWLNALEWLVLVGVAAIALCEIATAFNYAYHRFAHDEAEHLHVVFALQRGERPYLDFVENHPLMLHAIVAAILERIHFDDVARIYLALKALVAAHCIATFALFWQMAAPLLRLNSRRRAATVFLLTLVSLGVWHESPSRVIWQLRPDWVCYFYATAFVHLYQTGLRKSLGPIWEGRKGLVHAPLAGVSGGFAIAVLPKAVLVLVTCGLTVAVMLLSCGSEMMLRLLARWRSILAFHAVVAVALVATLASCVSLELALNHVDLGVYYKANYIYNAAYRVLALGIECNPIAVLAQMAGLTLSGATLTGLLLYVLLKHEDESFGWDCRAILTYCILCVLVNVVVPAYTNGITWAHYFIPSLLAITVVFAYIVSRLVRLAASVVQIRSVAHIVDVNVSSRPWLAKFLWSVAVLEFASLLGARGAEALARQTIQNSNETVISLASHRVQLSPERYLPDDLTYLTVVPSTKPVKARAWGYFFMLFADRNAFSAMSSLGFAPKLEEHWLRLFRSSPPDVILLPSRVAFDDWRVTTRIAGNGDLLWLWPYVEEQFACRTNGTLRLFVGNAIGHRFPAPQWRACPSSVSTESRL